MGITTNGIFVILISVVTCGLAYLEHDSWSVIELHHALGADRETFTFRGNITSCMTSGHCNTNQKELTANELDKLRALAAQDDFYPLRATVVYLNGHRQQFLTSTKACSLIQSQLNDVLWISLDASGFVTSITQTSTTNSLECLPETIAGVDDREFSTDVMFRLPESAPVPDTASFIQKVEREREARERGEVRDNRGFFAKYWMYIVPVVLLVFISGATNQEAPK